MAFFLPALAFLSGGGSAWWITKETAKEVVEAGKDDNPNVVIGSNYSIDAMTVLVVVALIAWYFWHKKGKG